MSSWSLVKTPVEIQAVFDVLDAYVASIPWAASATASVAYTGGGVTHSITVNDRENLNGISYSERTVGARVGIEPVSAVLHPGESKQFTASAINADGTPNTAPIVWSLPVGAPGTVDASGLYTAPPTIPSSTSTVLTAVQGQSWSSATIALQPATP